MRINNNVSALASYNRLAQTDNKISKNLEKLSSGLRINRAADDAAGLTISEKMRSQIRGLTRAVQNVQDGVNVIQTAEGGLAEIHAVLQRMNELAVQAANETNSVNDRANIQAEVVSMREEIENIAVKTKFNGKSLLNGDLSGSGALKIQVGFEAGSTEDIEIGTMRIAQLGSTTLKISVIDLTTTAGASGAISAIGEAINQVSTQRASLGAMQNRFDHKINNLNNYIENLTAAESRIRDVDMAKEMAEFTKNQILAQAGTSMLAQANQKPQSIMSLLGN